MNIAVPKEGLGPVRSSISSSQMISCDEARKLTQSIGSPLLLGSRNVVQERLKLFQESLKDVRLFYAVKSNDDSTVLELVAKLGGGFDIASIAEWDKAHSAIQDICSEQRAFFDTNTRPQIIHSHPCKSESDLQQTYAAGCRNYVVDCVDEIDKLAQWAPDSQVLLRIAAPDQHSQVPMANRFGVDPRNCLSIFEHALKKGVSICGIAFHVGSQSYDVQQFQEALGLATIAWSSLSEKYPGRLRVLNIGGGIPIAYANSPSIDLDGYLWKLNRMLVDTKIILRRSSPAMEVWAEPGRAIAGEAVSLLTTIIGKQERNDQVVYTIDDGVYGSFSGRYFDCETFEVWGNARSSGQTQWIKGTRQSNSIHLGSSSPNRTTNEMDPFHGCRMTMIAGPSCDGGDVVARHVLLPEMNRGDLLLFKQMGAYCNVTATSFNGIPAAKKIWL